MSTNTIIRSSIASLDGEIQRLTVAREKLVAILGDEDQPTTRKRTTGRRTAAVANTTSKKSRSPRSTASKRTAKRSNGEGESRKDQIVALLDEGLSPREIGDELGIAPNYVYHVKRSLATA